MKNLTSLVSFYRGHVQMSMFGFRCQLREHFKIYPGDEVATDDVAISEELNKIDQIVTDCIQALEVEPINFDVLTIKDIDTVREKFENLTKQFKDKIDAIMASQIMRERLLKIFLEQQKQQQINAAKDAVNPANITGSPAELNGATTAIINKDGDVKPAEEKKEVPQNENTVPETEK